MNLEMDRDELLGRWSVEGWLHLPRFFGEAEIAGINRVVDALWRSKPRDVTVDDVDRKVRCRMSGLSDSDRAHRVKISDLYLVSPPVRAMLLDRRLLTVVEALLDDAPVLCNSLNLEKSSGQEYHADSLYMTPLSAGGVVACWIALEDVQPGSGPLRLYPASHLIAPFAFSDGTSHAHDGEMPQWAAYMQSEIDSRSLSSVSVFAKAGDLVIWHSDLLHGAEPITETASTRRSLVAHYYRHSDCVRRGYLVDGTDGAFWWRRRPQPVDWFTRLQCAIERRVQRMRARTKAY
ncbi:MAG TPA: phytanoyl-CoA dioxygenase family protein [Thermoanaerobaculia bacterium]|jgi:hypothetical protein|nr:phytanoyl-CoA dioxygenase family protein [Thermoanaerobaculia bacterium]